MTRPTKAVPMCCVRIDYMTFLLPASQGMKLVELMQNAFKCVEGYADRGYEYSIEADAPRVGLMLVQPGQIKTPAKTAPQLQIGHDA